METSCSRPPWTESPRRRVLGVVRDQVPSMCRLIPLAIDDQREPKRRCTAAINLRTCSDHRFDELVQFVDSRNGKRD